MRSRRCAFQSVALLVLLYPFQTAPADEPAKKDAPAAKSDHHGDPLPEGAVARLGSSRFRHAAQTLAFSRDGKYLAASGQVTRLFDAVTGKTVRTFNEASNYLFFLPDQKTLITTTYGFHPVIRLWDIETGKETRSFRAAGGGNFYPTWSADGKVMATYCYQENKGPVVTLWDMEKGRETKALQRPIGQRAANQIALAPDGKTFALRETASIYLLDAEARELHRLITPTGTGGKTLETQTMAFTPDGKTLVCTDQENVTLWDTETGKLRRKLEMPQDDPVAVALSPEGRFLAVGCVRGATHVWDLKADKVVCTIPDGGTNMSAYLLAVAPEGKYVANQQHLVQSIRVWDVAAGKETSIRESFSTHIDSLAFSPDGKSITAVGPGDPVIQWDLASGKPIRNFPIPHFLGLQTGSALAFTPDAKNLIVRLPEQIITCDVATGKVLHDSVKGAPPPDPTERDRRRFHAHCAPDGNTIVVDYLGDRKAEVPAPKDGGLRRPPLRLTAQFWRMVGVWDVQTGRIDRPFRVEAESLNHTLLAPDGKTLVAACTMTAHPEQTFVFLWDLTNGSELRRFSIPEIGFGGGIALSGDGKMLISGPHAGAENGARSLVRFWELATGRERTVREIGHDLAAQPQVAFFGDRVAALAENEVVHLIDLSTGKVSRQLRGHDGKISCLEFSRDGKRLATGSADTTVLVWDVAATGKPPEKIQLAEKEVADLWADLAGEDAAKAYKSIRKLAQSPDQAVTLITNSLQPVPNVNEDRIARLVADLDSDEFNKREDATRELTQLGSAAEKAIREALKGTPSLEFKHRAGIILDKLTETTPKAPPVPTGDLLRLTRAVEVLETIGSPDVEKLLARMAKGAPNAPLTREAQAALARLTKRNGRTP